MNKLDHYIELKAIPQMEMLQTDVIAHALQILHKFLPLYQGNVGIAFPAYGLGRSLGGIIRLFAEEQTAKQLHQQIVQSGLQDYLLVSIVQAVPEEVLSHRCYRRVHRKGQSAIRRTEKYLAAQGKWNEEIRQNMQLHQQTQPVFPHVKLKSASTGQQFVLAIQQHISTFPKEGNFNAYGLSATATLPHF